MARRVFDYLESAAKAVVDEAQSAEWRVVNLLAVQRGVSDLSPFHPRVRAAYALYLLDAIAEIRKELVQSRRESTARVVLTAFLAGPNRGDYQSHAIVAARQRAGRRLGGQTRAAQLTKVRNLADAQPFADEVWARHPNWTISAVAREVAKQIELAPNYIRTLIKRPRDPRKK